MGRASTTPVHGATDKFLRSIGIRGLFPGGGSSSRRSTTTPKPRTKPVTDYRAQARANMAVARSYHSRSGTTYDPVSGRVSGSGKTIGAPNTGKMYSTSRSTSRRKRKG